MKLKDICPIIGLYLAPFVSLKLGILGSDISSQNCASRLSTTIFGHQQNRYHMNNYNQVIEIVSLHKFGLARFHATSRQEWTLAKLQPQKSQK
jgi:hypothetical protein